MNHSLPTPLPVLDCLLLRAVSHIIPVSERADWFRCWHAELWHRRNPYSDRVHGAIDLYPGLLSDAVWLRVECWRRATTGTAVLCLAVLASMSLIAMLPLLALFSRVELTIAFLSTQMPRLVIEASLTTVVGFALASRPVESSTPFEGLRFMKAKLFHASKLVLVQIIAYELSLALTQPFHSVHALAMVIVQAQLFTLLALLGLRWNFLDQDARCRHCLRTLASPSRVGRPSWNFLESNGTHLTCPDGHGLLSIPEIETSWRQNSEWIAQ